MNKMKKTASFLLIAAMLLSVICIAPFSAVAATKNILSTADGDFTEISTADQLMDVINVHKENGGFYPNQRVKLMNDITINTYGLDSSFRNSNESNQRFFRGVFDGNNHTITVKSNNDSDVLEPLFDNINGSLNETRIYDLNLVYKNDVYGAPFAYDITTTIEDTQPNFQDINVEFKNVIPIANINSNRTCACGFTCVTDATKYKSISVTGNNIGNLTPANSTYVLASGFASIYSNTQAFFEDISIEVDNIQGCADTDAHIVCVTGLTSVPTVVGAFYRDIHIDVKNDIKATGVSGSNADILACGVSLSSQYFYNADVKVGGDISAVGYAKNSTYYIDGNIDSIIGAFGISYDLRSNSTNDSLLNASYFPESFKNLNNMGAMSVDVEGDIKSETLGNGSYPMFTSAAGASFKMSNYVPFNNTTINVEGDISATSKDISFNSSYGHTTLGAVAAGLSIYGLDHTYKRAEKHFSVEHCTINAGNIISEANYTCSRSNGAFAFLYFPCKDVHVNANSIIGKGGLAKNCYTAGFANTLSPDYSYGGSKVALDNCSVYAKTITTIAEESYAYFAGFVIDAYNVDYAGTIQNCTLEVTDNFSSASLSDMNLFIRRNLNKLYNNAVIIPSTYSEIYSLDYPDEYFDYYGGGFNASDNNKYVKFTFIEREDRSHNTYIIDDYDNWNNWENSNTVTIGDKSYETVCAYTSRASSVNFPSLWQLKEIDNSFKFHVNEPNKADRIFRVYNGDASDAEDKTAYTFTNGKVEAFYNIPAFAGDDYVFAGWYYHADGDKDGDIPFEFGADIPANLTDVYAHWIPVGEVSKDDGDDKDLPDYMNGKYSGFELFGVQIRPDAQFDLNLGEYYHGGLRFITSISEDLLSSIDDLSNETVNGNKVEYGFVTAAWSIIDKVAHEPTFHIDADSYKIQYKDTNVNGVDTTVIEKSANNFNYVTNVDCTSQIGEYGSDAKIKRDHQNFDNYRLATYVVTYKDHPENLTKDVVARAYLRYYDANGLLRTFYNDYGGNMVYGGCSVSYQTVLSQVGKSKTAIA